MPQNPCSASQAENTVDPSKDSSISRMSGSGNCSTCVSFSFNALKSDTHLKPADDPSANGFLLTSSIGEHQVLDECSIAPILIILSTSLSITSRSYLDMRYGLVYAGVHPGTVGIDAVTR